MKDSFTCYFVYIYLLSSYYDLGRSVYYPFLSIMFLLILILSLSFILLLLLKVGSFIASEKMLLIREETSSYECGFEHHNVSRVPFSLRYFFLTLIFLLFDLEIVLIIFLPFIVFSVNYSIALLVLLIFVIILYLSLIYEWNDGRLEWVS